MANVLDKAEYEMLVAQTKRDPSSVDYRQLLSCRPDQPRRDADRQAMVEALSRKDWPTAARFAECILARDFTDIDAHALLCRFHDRSGDPEQARFHERVARGLRRASPAKADRQAYKGYSEGLPVGEEYTIMSIYGLQLCRQALSEQVGHFFDVHMIRDRPPEHSEE